jgi:hypothetical protein
MPPDFDPQKFRPEFEAAAETYDLPEILTAFDAVIAAMTAVEDHEQSEEIMMDIMQRMSPLLNSLPAMMMGGFGGI